MYITDTREGRCGEWANCFGAILRSFDFQVRECHNVFEDHVWVEVKSFGRWMHCDPCEDSIDQPLLYMLGWKKPVNLCLSVSIAEGVRDVTWRYNNQHEQLKKDRVQYLAEKWLLEFIKTNESKRTIAGWGKDVQHPDWITEAIEFLTPPKDIDASNFKERQSGSAQWRKSRGEASNPIEARSIKVGNGNSFKFSYCCSTDKYNINGNEETGWAKYTFNSKDIFRKVENDWNQVYLARWEYYESLE